MSEIFLKVGKKGEIYTNKKLRKLVGIKEGGFVKAYVRDGKLVIEPIPSVEDIIKKPLVRLSPEKAEELSIESQKEVGIYG